MITWFQVWPLLLFPYVITFIAGLYPFVREYLLNHLLIPLVPYDLAVDLVDWYSTASVAKELLLHLIISLNIGTLLYPLFYLVGLLFININNGIIKAKITSLNQQ